MSDLKLPDLNSVIIAGYLTRDPVLRATSNGTPVANFPIAYSRKFKDNTGKKREDVCYVGIVAWYKLAESCSDNLRKGNAVVVDGELQSNSLKMDNGFYRNIVEIKAKRIQFLNRQAGTGDFDGDAPESGKSIRDEINFAMDRSLDECARQHAEGITIDSAGGMLNRQDNREKGEQTA